eukprot:7270638-Pyramimonas_sp.AAC.1
MDGRYLRSSARSRVRPAPMHDATSQESTVAGCLPPAAPSPSPPPAPARSCTTSSRCRRVVAALPPKSEVTENFFQSLSSQLTRASSPALPALTLVVKSAAGFPVPGRHTQPVTCFRCERKSRLGPARVRSRSTCLRASAV